MRLRDYVVASWIGMLPGTVMYVYFGTAFKSLAEVVSGNVHGGTAHKALLGIGLAVTVAVTVYVTRVARKAIREYVDAEPVMLRWGSIVPEHAQEVPDIARHEIDVAVAVQVAERQ